MCLDYDLSTVAQAQAGDGADARLIKESPIRGTPKLAAAELLKRKGDGPGVIDSVDGELYVGNLPFGQMCGNGPKDFLVYGGQGRIEA